MPNVKSPGNDGLTKEFFGIFWSEVKKKTFLSCIFHSFGKEELCTSQRQGETTESLKDIFHFDI